MFAGSPEARAFESRAWLLDFLSVVEALFVEQDVDDLDPSPAPADSQAKEGAYRRVTKLQVECDYGRFIPVRHETGGQGVSRKVPLLKKSSLDELTRSAMLAA